MKRTFVIFWVEFLHQAGGSSNQLKFSCSVPAVTWEKSRCFFTHLWITVLGEHVQQRGFPTLRVPDHHDLAAAARSLHGGVSPSRVRGPRGGGQPHPASERRRRVELTRRIHLTRSARALRRVRSRVPTDTRWWWWWRTLELCFHCWPRLPHFHAWQGARHGEANVASLHFRVNKRQKPSIFRNTH